MTGIWGHEHVKIEKDVEARCWHVRTLQGALLCKVPWSDAFREFKYAPDYAIALATCMQPETALTQKEERLAYQDFTAQTTKPSENTAEKAPDKVIRVDFKNKKRCP